jgi:hypothetical protein
LFQDGYLNGSKNNDYIIPLTIYGLPWVLWLYYLIMT